MDINEIKKHLNALSGDEKAGAIKAIKDILNCRKSPNASSDGSGDNIEIDPDLIEPTSGRKGEPLNKQDYDDPEGLLDKRKFHNTKPENKDSGKDSNPEENDGGKNAEGKTDVDKTYAGKTIDDNNVDGKNDALEQHKPQIGDCGDPNSGIQKAEDIFRKAHQYKSEAEKAAEKAKANGDFDEAKDQKELAADAYELAGKAKEAADKAKDSGGLSDADARRIQEIKAAFADLSRQKELIDETDKNVYADRVAEYDKKIRKETHKSVSYGDINAFKRSIENFMRDTLSDDRGYTWRRFNKNLVGTGLLGKGRAHIHDHRIPTLAVYFDQSCSWGEDDVERGFKAISALNKFVEQGKLKIQIYYFANNIHDNPNAARREGGTCYSSVILDHIKATHPNNVVIMTDTDVDYGKHVPTAVNGGVWLLFRDGYISSYLTTDLRGRKLNKVFTI